MYILQNEYEQRRNIFNFCIWIRKKLIGLEAREDFNEMLYERKEQTIKKLIEEAIPISYFGLYFYRPHLEITVKCLCGNQPYDGEIEINDRDSSKMIKIEVTTTENDISTMHRQALARNGKVWLSGPIRRNKRQIISEGGIANIDSECEKIVDLSFQRFVSKIEHGYDNQTAILVNVVDYWDIPIRYHAALLERTRQYLWQYKPDIYGAYYCFTSSPGIEGIRNKPRLLIPS